MSWENACFECGRYFDHVNNLNTHLKSRKHHRGHYCLKCERMFHSENGLARHIEVVHHHPCNTCKLEFETEEQLNDHDKIFHRIQCGQCEKVFRSDEARDQHRKAVHKIICCTCKMTFDDELALTNHNLAFHTFRCEECPTRIFKTSNALEAHWRSPVHHLQCMKCRQIFKDERSCFQHSSSQHSYACPHCSRSFTKQLNLDKHLEAGHRLPCQWCSETFETAQTLEVHHASVHVSECLVCQQKFGDPGKLQVHQKSCTIISDQAAPIDLVMSPVLLEPLIKRKFFECPICEEVSESSTAAFEHTLTTHMYRCQDCKAHFEEQLDLFTHICYAKSHTQGLIPLETTLYLRCQKCGESFSNAEQFSNHAINSHLLKCAQCPGQLFSTMAILAEHSRVTHNRRIQPRNSENTPATNDSEVSRCLEFSSLSSERESPFYSAQSSLNSLPNFELVKSDQLPAYQIERGYDPKNVFRCDLCDESFTNCMELERHFKHSPFHGEIELKCHECNTTFFNQIQLLTHINSKPHKAKRILSLI